MSTNWMRPATSVMIGMVCASQFATVSPASTASLPDVLEPIARLTPLWHGVELCRGAVHGRLSLEAAAFHTAYLLAFSLIGLALAARTFRRKLTA